MFYFRILFFMLIGAILAMPRLSSADPSCISAPDDLTVESVTPHRISIKWDDPPELSCGGSIEANRLYRDGLFIGHSSPHLVRVSDGNVIPGEQYTYTITALDSLGNESLETGPITINIPGSYIPNKITPDIKVAGISFSDYEDDTPYSISDIHDYFNDGDYAVKKYFEEISYGKIDIDFTIENQWIELPDDASDYCTTPPADGNTLGWYNCDYGKISEDYFDITGDDPDDYETFVFLVNGMGTAGIAAGWQYISARRVSKIEGIVIHELGHDLNLRHSAVWDCELDEYVGPDLYDLNEGDCNFWTYQDFYDPMGGGIFHFNMMNKFRLGVISKAQVAIAEEDGEYLIDQAELDSNGNKMLKIRLPDKKDNPFYFCEYRTRTGFNLLAENYRDSFQPSIQGVQCRFRPALTLSNETFIPRSIFGFGNHSKHTVKNLTIVEGMPFIDKYRGITVELLEELEHDPNEQSDDQARIRITGIDRWEDGYRPVIRTAQTISVDEDEEFSYSMSLLEIWDPDSQYPQDFTLTILDGDHYTTDGSDVTIDENYTDELVLNVSVSDGEFDSEPYGVDVDITPINDAPVITEQADLETNQEEPLTLSLNDITVSDPDNDYPDDFTLHIYFGLNYTINHALQEITPADNFSGQLNVPIRVRDGTDLSDSFTLEVTVIPTSGGSSGGSSSGGSSSGGSSSGGSSSGGSSSGGSSSGGSGGSNDNGPYELKPLSNGDTRPGLGIGSTSETRHFMFYIDVPAGASDLVVSIWPGENSAGNADLYVRKDEEPTDELYDCRPYIVDNLETCGGDGDELATFEGRYFIRIKASPGFDDVGLSVNYTEPPVNNDNSTSPNNTSSGSNAAPSGSGGGSLSVLLLILCLLYLHYRFKPKLIKIKNKK